MNYFKCRLLCTDRKEYIKNYKNIKFNVLIQKQNGYNVTIHILFFFRVLKPEV